jgi:hypothetical protein
MDPSAFYNALVGDPFYVISKAYRDSSQALHKSTLDTESGIAGSKNALTNQRIQFNLADTQRNITNDLANRQATESGDNAFYHTHASQLAGFDTQQASLDLQDYLAGIQAAYAQFTLDNEYGGQGDLFDAYGRVVNYYQGLNQGDPNAGDGTGSPPPEPPPAAPPPTPVPPYNPNSPPDSVPGGHGGV